MITAPTSLRGRVTFSGVVVITVLVLALDVFVYLSLRDRMLSNLERVIDARHQLVLGLRDELSSEELAARLRLMGLRAVVRTPEGVEHRSGGAPAFDAVPAGESSDGGGELVGRSVRLADGGQTVVFASRGGIDATLDRLLLLEGIGTLVVVVLAYAILARSSARVLRPLRDVSRTARSIAGGRLDRRLETGDEQELAEMAAAFNDMLDALEEAISRSQRSEASSRRFLADAAHQLRTPAAGIRASVATMLRTEDAADRERMLDNLARESARMSRLLHALLRVARLDSGETPTREPTGLAALVEESVERQRALAPRLRFSVEADTAAIAHVDAMAVDEALGNLLDNAVRHARSQVGIEVRTDGGEAVVRVHDDGPGVPAGDRERIFDRFVSLRRRDGSGLGLPIARGIAEANGGRLDHDGEAFVLRLPRAAG